MKVKFQVGRSYALVSFVVLYASYIFLGRGLEVGRYLFYSLPASLIIGLVGAMLTEKEEDDD